MKDKREMDINYTSGDIKLLAVIIFMKFGIIHGALIKTTAQNILQKDGRKLENHSWHQHQKAHFMKYDDGIALAQINLIAVEVES